MLKQFIAYKKDVAIFDGLIEKLVEEMDRVGPASEEYPALLKNLSELNDARAAIKPKPVSRDTLFLVGGNILGIVAIILFEKTDVMSSKAFTHVIRPLK